MAYSFLCTAALLVAVLAAPALSQNHTAAPPGQTGSGMNGTVFQVTSISPSQDLSTSGSDPVTVMGTGFSAGMTGKTAAQAAATPVTVAGSTSAYWVVPMGIGMGVQISFVSDGYTSTTTFNYKAPAVTSISPALVPQGVQYDGIVVTGTNLGYPGLAASTFECGLITGQTISANSIVGATTVLVNISAQSTAQSPKAVTATLGSRTVTVNSDVKFEVSSSSVAGAKKVQLSVQNYVEATFKADMAIIAGVASPDQIFIVSVTVASAGSEFHVQEYDLRAASTVQFIVLPTAAEPEAETSGLANVEKAAKDGSLASKFPSASGLVVDSKTVTIESTVASAEPEGKVSKGWIAAVVVTAIVAFVSIVVVIYHSMHGNGAPKESMEPTFKPPVGGPPKEGEGSSGSGSGSTFSKMCGRIKSPFRKAAPADVQKTADPAAAPGGARMQELRVV